MVLGSCFAHRPELCCEPLLPLELPLCGLLTLTADLEQRRVVWFCSGQQHARQGDARQGGVPWKLLVFGFPASVRVISHMTPGSFSHGRVRADLLLRAAWAPLQLQECSLSPLPSPHWLLNTGPDTSHSEPLCDR